MKLYHVGFKEIREPQIDHGRINADFSRGFYLSDNKEFSMRWARKRYGEDTYINTYELNTDNLKIKKLRRDKYWFNYIYRNRRGYKDIYDNYDVIIGPVANDTLFDSLGMITSGVFSPDESCELMKIGNRYTQVVIKTEEGLNNLVFQDSEIIPDEVIESYRQQVHEEEKEYQRLLADKIGSF